MAATSEQFSGNGNLQNAIKKRVSNLRNSQGLRSGNLFLFLRTEVDIKKAEKSDPYFDMALYCLLCRGYDHFSQALSNGNLPYFKDHDGNSLLHLACGLGNEHGSDKENSAIIERLMLDLQVNARNDFGHTPLMVAAACGNEGIVKTLLSYKTDPADASLRDKNSYTAMTHLLRCFTSFCSETAAYNPNNHNVIFRKKSLLRIIGKLAETNIQTSNLDLQIFLPYADRYSNEQKLLSQKYEPDIVIPSHSYELSL